MVSGITTNTRYNAEGNPLVSVQKQMISDLSATLASKSISADVRGNVSMNWAEYTAPAKVTSFTSCYKYDSRGHKIAEWGTSIQPASFGYDERDNMVSLSTFRAGDETITTVPSERTDKDTTTWTFHPLTGAELTKTYDAYNRVLTETDARGKVKANTYEPARGPLPGTTYSDCTSPRAYTYNHLDQLTQVTDAAGIRTLSYNSYGGQLHVRHGLG